MSTETKTIVSRINGTRISEGESSKSVVTLHNKYAWINCTLLLFLRHEIGDGNLISVGNLYIITCVS